MVSSSSIGLNNSLFVLHSIFQSARGEMDDHLTNDEASLEYKLGNKLFIFSGSFVAIFQQLNVNLLF